MPAAARLQQLETNLVRLRSYSGDLGPRFVIVNLPAASVETVENGVVYSHHRAGVGRIDRQSPIMQTTATEINFNPFWHVPPSLIKKDLIPKMKADPNYLTEEKIHVFDKDGQDVSPSSINWNTDEATHYKYRQDTGADINSLGFVRINIPNPYGVYMHDTPDKGIFGDDFRFVSSGCVRVQDVRDYVAWLLKDNPGWDRDQIDEVIRSGQRHDVKLTQPVPVYWVYVTAWATPDGVVQFRPDIYQRDGAGPGPVAWPFRCSRWRCRRNSLHPWAQASRFPVEPFQRLPAPLIDDQPSRARFAVGGECRFERPPRRSPTPGFHRSETIGPALLRRGPIRTGRFRGSLAWRSAAGRGSARDLIRDPPEALLAPEHREHVEDARRGRAAGQRRAQRLGDDAELCAFLFRIGAHDSLRACRRPLCRARSGAAAGS